jgi:hypothetical protein
MISGIGFLPFRTIQLIHPVKGDQIEGGFPVSAGADRLGSGDWFASVFSNPFLYADQTRPPGGRTPFVDDSPR